MNIRDIADKAKVSVATVSRIMDPGKKKLVNPKTRAKVEKVIRRYHYVPNRSAQALSKHSTHTIGMVTPFSPDIVRSPYFEGLIAGMIEGIKPLSYDMKWIMIRDEEACGLKLNDLLQRHAVDGVVFLAWRLMSELVKEIEKKADVPAVLINDYDEHVRSSIVYCENKPGMKQICAFLASKNYSKIGMLRGPEEVSPDAHERYEAFKAGLKQHKIAFHEKYTEKCERFDEDSGYRAMQRWFDRGDLPQVIVCANDDLAWGAMRFLQKIKVRIPEQIGIVGYDDAPRSEWTHPQLTTVRQPTEEMGKAAIETLIKLISGKDKKPVQIKFEPRLMIRESA